MSITVNVDMVGDPITGCETMCKVLVEWVANLDAAIEEADAAGAKMVSLDPRPLRQALYGAAAVTASAGELLKTQPKKRRTVTVRRDADGRAKSYEVES